MKRSVDDLHFRACENTRNKFPSFSLPCQESSLAQSTARGQEAMANRTKCLLKRLVSFDDAQNDSPINLQLGNQQVGRGSRSSSPVLRQPQKRTNRFEAKTNALRTHRIHRSKKVLSRTCRRAVASKRSAKPDPRGAAMTAEDEDHLSWPSGGVRSPTGESSRDAGRLNTA